MANYFALLHRVRSPKSGFHGIHHPPENDNVQGQYHGNENKNGDRWRIKEKLTWIFWMGSFLELKWSTSLATNESWRMGPREIIIPVFLIIPKSSNFVNFCSFCRCGIFSMDFANVVFKRTIWFWSGFENYLEFWIES